MIPDEAVEAAAKAHFEHGWGDSRQWEDAEPEAKSEARDDMRAALEAAIPILLSHEREETRLAHLDAVVNAATVDRLERELHDERQKVELLLSTQSRPAALFALAEAWDRGIESGVDGSVPECDYARNPYRPPGVGV